MTAMHLTTTRVPMRARYRAASTTRLNVAAPRARQGSRVGVGPVLSNAVGQTSVPRKPRAKLAWGERVRSNPVNQGHRFSAVAARALWAR